MFKEQECEIFLLKCATPEFLEVINTTAKHDFGSVSFTDCSSYGTRRVVSMFFEDGQFVSVDYFTYDDHDDNVQFVDGFTEVTKEVLQKFIERAKASYEKELQKYKDL